MTDSLQGQLDRWIERDPDPATRGELVAYLDNGQTEEIAARFAGRLQFGTAGIRGIVGAGPMRMNRLVVRETSAGLASYLIDSVPRAAERGVVVAYDARPDSRQFAEDAACVFMGAGLKVFLTERAQPTPVGAFGVLALDAAAGIVVTASHNPPEYNGYKVYWENGAQIVPPHDSAIADRIDGAARADLPWMDLATGSEAGLLESLGEDFVARYRSRVARAVAAWRRDCSRISIAYTALHGVGAEIAETLLNDAGFIDVRSVAEQRDPDGRFPTVRFPNPEEPGAMDAVIALAAENECALACANDPDADRLAVAARDAAGEYVMLSGDQIGVLLGDYCLSRTKASAQIVGASMVSSRLLGTIARTTGAHYIETLTGFKWLANVALQNETDGRKFLFAYEEALGYALGQVVRDKDGLSALLLFAQMAAELATDGRTVLDQIEALYRRHGLFLTQQRSIRTDSSQPRITDQLRAALPQTIGGVDVISTKDLLNRCHLFADGSKRTLDGYPNDVLMFYLADDSRVIVRPSGTEPKTKCYYEAVRNFTTGEGYAGVVSATQQKLDALAAAHQRELARMIG